MLSMCNTNSFYNQSKSNNYSYYNTENNQGELERNEKVKFLNNNIISIKRKNNFIQRNNFFNCLFKLKNIIDNNINLKSKAKLKIK